MSARGGKVSARLSLGILCAFVALALAGPHLAPQPPARVHLETRLAGPSARFLLGTDDLGRDIFSRLLAGARVSLIVAACSITLSALFGAPAGLAAGYMGGAFDATACRVMDMFMAVPGILLAICISAFLGKGFLPLVLALSATSWVGYARLARSLAMGLRHREFVQASVSLGAGTPRILLLHIFPGAAGLLAVQTATGTAGVILSEASLSFLGLGVQPPHPSWGGMLASGCDALLEAPHMAIAPGVCLFGVVWALYATGDALSDRLDPARRPGVGSL